MARINASTTLFVLIPLLIGGYFIVNGTILRPPPWQTLTWEQTTGTISGVSVFFDAPMFHKKSGKYSSFLARINYQFELHGQSQTGTDGEFQLERYHREHIDQAEAERRASERFVIGNPIDVFYNPVDPSQSTLQPGLDNRAALDLFMGAVCLWVAVWMGWTFLKSPSRSVPRKH